MARTAGGFFGAEERQRQPGELIFHPMTVREYNIPGQFGGTNIAEHLGTRPKHTSYVCGAAARPPTVVWFAT